MSNKNWLFSGKEENYKEKEGQSSRWISGFRMIPRAASNVQKIRVLKIKVSLFFSFKSTSFHLSRTAFYNLRLSSHRSSSLSSEEEGTKEEVSLFSLSSLSFRSLTIRKRKWWLQLMGTKETLRRRQSNLLLWLRLLIANLFSKGIFFPRSWWLRFVSVVVGVVLMYTNCFL